MLCATWLLIHAIDTCSWHRSPHIDGLVQERRNSIALAMELRLSCTNPSIYSGHFAPKDSPRTTHSASMKSELWDVFREFNKDQPFTIVAVGMYMQYRVILDHDISRVYSITPHSGNILGVWGGAAWTYCHLGNMPTTCRSDGLLCPKLKNWEFTTCRKEMATNTHHKIINIGDCRGGLLW